MNINSKRNIRENCFINSKYFQNYLQIFLCTLMDNVQFFFILEDHKYTWNNLPSAALFCVDTLSMISRAIFFSGEVSSTSLITLRVLDWLLISLIVKCHLFVYREFLSIIIFFFLIIIVNTLIIILYKTVFLKSFIWLSP